MQTLIQELRKAKIEAEGTQERNMLHFKLIVALVPHVPS